MRKAFEEKYGFELPEEIYPKTTRRLVYQNLKNVYHNTTAYCQDKNKDNAISTKFSHVEEEPIFNFLAKQPLLKGLFAYTIGFEKGPIFKFYIKDLIIFSDNDTIALVSTGGANRKRKTIAKEKLADVLEFIADLEGCFDSHGYRWNYNYDLRRL